MTIFILGGGPTALAVADAIIDNNLEDFIIFERGTRIGGMAQTLTWDGIGSHDLGPHKIFSQKPELVSRVENLLPKDSWLTREKISSVYMNGHYLPYPPSPFSLLKVFGLIKFIKILWGYGYIRLTNIFKSKKPATFEEDLIVRLGEPLYESLFKPIAEKLWDDPRKLDVKLSRGRVQTPSLLEIISRMLRLKKDSTFEALTFRYPKGGLGQLWSAIQKKSDGKGKFLLNHTITNLQIVDKRITAIHYQTADNHDSCMEVKPTDYVVSTLPLTLTCKLINDHLPDRLKSIADNVIVLNDLLLMFLHIDRPSLLDESWVFVPDPDIIFHRISEQESFDPNMSQNGSIVCCEIMNAPNRSHLGKSDEELFQIVKAGLTKMGYIDFNILTKKIIRLPKSYPVFKVGYEESLTHLLNALDEFDNFKTIGRQGAFNYIGTLDAMDIGYGFADWYTNRSAPWTSERERTKHYPVLD